MIYHPTILLKTEGIGNGISDYLDNTIAFASFAIEQTNANSLGMFRFQLIQKQELWVWLGINALVLTPMMQKLGFEWNKEVNTGVL